MEIVTADPLSGWKICG